MQYYLRIYNFFYTILNDQVQSLFHRGVQLEKIDLWGTHKYVSRTYVYLDATCSNSRDTSLAVVQFYEIGESDDRTCKCIKDEFGVNETELQSDALILEIATAVF